VHKSLPLLSVLLLASPALAANWVVDPVTSRLNFEGEQAGEKFKGSFGKFASDITFDEAAPEQGKIAITIDMASAQIDGKDRMDSLPTDDWFAVKKFSVAQFVSTSIRALGSDKDGIKNYEAIGHLTIRGISKEIALPFSLKTTGRSAVARGNVTLNRSDYNVGLGQWKSDEWVKYPVHVSFEINASK
jgi:polyisoprenoid-binding protein YceI